MIEHAYTEDVILKAFAIMFIALPFALALGTGNALCIGSDGRMAYEPVTVAGVCISTDAPDESSTGVYPPDCDRNGCVDLLLAGPLAVCPNRPTEQVRSLLSVPPQIIEVLEHPAVTKNVNATFWREPPKHIEALSLRSVILLV